ncbi:MAG: regulator, partial [FCB group bacterium]
MKKIIILITIIILSYSKSYSQWVVCPNSGGNVNSIVFKGNNVFAGGWGSGVYLSTDNGANWNTANQGLNNLYVNTMAVSGNNIYAGTGDDFGGGGVYYSSDNGANWNLIGLNNIWIHSLGVNGNNIFAGTNGKGVFLSTNNGTNWTPLNTGIDTN